MNPKVIAFFLVMLIVAMFTYWAARENFEVHPPTPDTAEVSR